MNSKVALSVSKEGHFERPASVFRDALTPGGPFAPALDRYHLYVSLACPWAHRVLIMRALKGLETALPVTVVHWRLGPKGWHFAAEKGAEADPLMNAQYLSEVYQKAESGYQGRVTVPVLWDKQRQTIVNNESSELIRMLNSAFDDLGATPGDYYPEALRADIDAVNERVYETLNNGVYRCGFATSQQAYDEAYTALFATMDWLAARLSKDGPYLMGDTLTEADIRLFTTLVRFDAVYHGHFKCNQRQLQDYPALWAYTRRLYAQPAFAQDVNFFHIKHHYYESHLNINPTGIVPLGPDIDWRL
ncbi:MAG: glutathione S-transferase family protein [Neisseriaceae bacterium]|nr:glutathione S-transferase family protein [Neisseriaceae bacterium]MBP6861988.1 glutathione S-transferase family protein [Neisseriaceae bacterium]